VDERLRNLERAHLADPCPENHAAWLAARVRVGEVCVCRVHAFVAGQSVIPVGVKPSICPHCAGLTLRERVELAAYCGSEGAWIAADCDSSGGTVRAFSAWHFCHAKAKGASFRDFVRGLARWGQHVMVRAACAAAQKAWMTWWPTMGGILDEVTKIPADRALEAAEAYRDDPSEANLEAWANATPVMDMPLWVPRPGQRRDREIINAAILAGEKPIREAICKALATWSLA